jgi:hypothetical protein
VAGVHSQYRGDMTQLQATIRALREQIQVASARAGD